MAESKKNVEGSSFKELVQWFPVFYAGMTFLGFIALYARYAPFGIDIAGYLSLAELLMAFINVTIPLMYVAAVLGLFTIVLFIVGVMKRPTSERFKPLPTADDFNPIEPISLMERWRLQWVNGIMGLGLPIMLLGYFFDGDAFSSTFILGPFIGMWIMSIESMIQYAKVRGSHIHNRFRISLYFLVLVAYIAIDNRTPSLRLLNGKIAQDVEIHTADSILVTTSDLLFVGRLDAGIILYDKVRSASVLVPTSEIRYVIAKDDRTPSRRAAVCRVPDAHPPPAGPTSSSLR